MSKVKTAKKIPTPSFPLLDKSRLARRYGVTVSCIEKWMEEGKVPYYRLSSRVVRFDPLECDRRLLAEYRAATAGAKRRTVRLHDPPNQLTLDLDLRGLNRPSKPKGKASHLMRLPFRQSWRTWHVGFAR